MPLSAPSIPALLRVIPPLSVGLLILMQAVLIPGLNLGAFKPEMGLMGVFFWAASGAGMFSYLAAFILGFAQDLLMGLPLGITALGFIVAVYVAHRWRVRPGSDHFARHWLGFALCASIVVLLTWAGVMMFYSAVLPALTPLLECLTTVALYPLLYRVLRRIRVLALRRGM